jgi:predicted transcriptional regulator
MKSVLISIQPKWCKLICSGEKTVEVRKNRPNCELPFKCYIYCTKGKPTFTQSAFCDDISNGKVIGEFVCDRIIDSFLNNNDGWFVELGCLTQKEIDEYQGDKAILYGWHISDLKIYDKPKELSEFWTIKCTNKKGTCGECKTKPNCIKPITRPFQSWGYVEDTK